MKLKYRPEIDGLRSLAVIPVILYHAGLYFSGGFVGVDVFFVISGYLITSIIIKEKSNSNFTFSDFYLRRARRILPALFVVMLSCIPFAYFWLMPLQFEEFSRSLIYISIFVSNFFFARQSGYFDTSVELKPLVHAWSLSVEEQYYFIFPILLIWLISSKRKIFPIIIISLLGVSSLCLAQLNILGNNLSYYSLATRFWELLIGATGAFIAYNEKSIISNVASIIGLILIISSIYFLSDDFLYPSLWTMLPVSGAFLVLVFSNSNNIVGKILSFRPLVILGLTSYSLYLWHQPIFAFVRYRQPDLISKEEFILLIIACFILSYITWRFIERPARNSKIISNKSVLILSITGILLFVFIGKIVEDKDGLPERFKIQPEVLARLNDHHIDGLCDSLLINNRSIGFCRYGNGDHINNPSLAVLGDSHSAYLLPALNSAATKNNSAFVHISDTGCPGFLGVYVLNAHNDNYLCKDLADAQYQYIKSHDNIKTIVLVCRWSSYTDGNYNGHGINYLSYQSDVQKDKENTRKVFSKAFEDTVNAYQEIGKNVVIIEQVPQQLFNIGEVYYYLADMGLTDEQSTKSLEHYSVSFIEHLHLQSNNRNIIKSMKTKRSVQLINLDNNFCPNNICLAGKAMHPYYWDSDHLTKEGAMLATYDLSKALFKQN